MNVSIMNNTATKRTSFLTLYNEENTKKREIVNSINLPLLPQIPTNTNIKRENEKQIIFNDACVSI